jgi:arylformamidase
MIAEISHNARKFKIALNDPIDLSLPLEADAIGPRAWYVGTVRMEPVQDGEKRYSVKDGAPVNFRNVSFNPHGHGTHTESVGHISPDVLPSVGNMLGRYWFTAQLVSIMPEHRRTAGGDEDHVITLGHLRGIIGDHPPEALVLRTLPNDATKRTRVWSGTNPTYVEAEACAWLRSIGIRHLLLDVPSVDRERDEGKLAAHHAFWDFPHSVDTKRTITEMIFVPDEVRDGDYILELQLPQFMNDAAPSRPVLYAILG